MKNNRIFGILSLFYLFFIFIFSNSHVSFTRSQTFRMKRNRFALFSKKDFFSIEKKLLFNWFWFWLKSFWNFISYWNKRDFISFSDYVTWNEIKFYFILFWNERKIHFISFHTIILKIVKIATNVIQLSIVFDDLKKIMKMLKNRLLTMKKLIKNERMMTLSSKINSEKKAFVSFAEIADEKVVTIESDHENQKNKFIVREKLIISIN